MYATVVGNVGNDAEVKTSKNGKSYLTFSVADSVGFGDNKRTQWVKAKVYGGSDKLASFIKKGSAVAVSGEVEVSEYNGKTYIWLTGSVQLISSGKSRSDQFGDVTAPKRTSKEDDLDPDADFP